MKKICSRCICDTTIPGIRFDDNGECQFCKIHEFMEQKYPRGEEGKARLEALLRDIKRSGRKKEYDCVLGVSGGRDSTYLLYLAVRHGLRPLAVHFDNGWNSEIATGNIRKACQKLDVDLYTHVADWEEFKSLQISFLKASVSDVDIPTDVAIFGTLHQAAAREGVKYILNGHSFRTEGVMPIGWTYMDGRYVHGVHHFFGNSFPNSVPTFRMSDLIRFSFLRGIRVVPFINYFDYDQVEVAKVLENELGWRYYGGHHHESHYVHFTHSYYLPKKFGIDKRIVEYSALVRSGQMSRDEALHEIETTDYPLEEEVVQYARNKFDFSEQDLQEIMQAPIKTFLDYPTYYPAMKKLAFLVKIACRLGLLPELLHHKYLA